jgi:DNA-binding transcriptional ArsR family regulator
MADKFIMVDMADERTSKIAEVLGNKTCKNILGSISESEKGLSPSEISTKLKIPLNTVDYNLKKLTSTGLVEESKSFFWSVKGRKIKTYVAANKKIIISTKPRFTGVIASALLFGVAGFAVKLFANIYGASMNVYGNNFINTAQPDMLEKMASGPDLVANAPSISDAAGLVSTNSYEPIIQVSSIFSNTFVWFALGALMGILGFVLYKKMKGGRL